jgi:hypothetical protein
MTCLNHKRKQLFTKWLVSFMLYIDTVCDYYKWAGKMHAFNFILFCTIGLMKERLYHDKAVVHTWRRLRSRSFPWGKRVTPAKILQKSRISRIQIVSSSVKREQPLGWCPAETISTNTKPGKYVPRKYM